MFYICQCGMAGAYTPNLMASAKATDSRDSGGIHGDVAILLSFFLNPSTQSTSNNSNNKTTDRRYASRSTILFIDSSALKFYVSWCSGYRRDVHIMQEPNLSVFCYWWELLPGLYSYFVRTRYAHCSRLAAAYACHRSLTIDLNNDMAGYVFVYK